MTGAGVREGLAVAVQQTMSLFLPPSDPRLSFFWPQPVDRTRTEVRLERFPPSAYAAIRNQIGPLANLRSSTGCAVTLRTDSPAVELRLERLRHHQPVPVGVACEVEQESGSWEAFSSLDLREQEGPVRVRFATGLERGAQPRTLMLWLPLISTCAVGGMALVDGCVVERAEPQEARWLAIGDSLTQGFSVQCPTQNWVHRLMRRWNLPVWNLGVGGLKIEPGVVDWALAARRWDLATIGLGSNHAWNDADAAAAPDRAAELAELALSGGHERVVWLLPSYKPCEEGKGPPDFAGVPLNRETGERVRRVRAALRQRLSAYAPRLEVIGDLAPQDARLYPDGLHPFALGFARYADNLDRALQQSPRTPQSLRTE
jgi:lysophospholipase L1-like esterase